MKLLRFVCTLLILSFFFHACNEQDDKTPSTSARAAGSGEEVWLSFNLEKGKSYTYDMKIEMTNQAGKDKMDSKMEFYYDMDVMDKYDSITSIRTAYRRVKMNMNMPRNKIDFDTDKSDEENNSPVGLNLLHSIMRAVIDKDFIIHLNSTGEVVKIEGLKEMEDAAINSLKLNEADLVKAKMAFAQQFNEENLKYSFSQAFNIFPDKPVKEGDSWEKTLKMAGTSSTLNTVYTVKEIRKNKIILESNTNMDVGSTRGNQKGILEVDPKTGLVMLSNMEQFMNAGTNKAQSKIRIEGREK